MFRLTRDGQPCIAVCAPDHLDLVAAQEGASPGELARAETFHRDEDRIAFLAAHHLARTMVAEFTGTEISDVVIKQHCATCGGDHGAPSVAAPQGVHVSWSHAPGLVGAVAAAAPVGIDVEPHATSVLDSVLTREEAISVRNSSDPSAAFTSIWTRKEVAVKLGLLSLDDLASYAVNGDRRISWIDVPELPVPASSSQPRRLAHVAAGLLPTSREQPI